MARHGIGMGAGTGGKNVFVFMRCEERVHHGMEGEARDRDRAFVPAKQHVLLYCSTINTSKVSYSMVATTRHTHVPAALRSQLPPDLGPVICHRSFSFDDSESESGITQHAHGW